MGVLVGFREDIEMDLDIQQFGFSSSQDDDWEYFRQKRWIEHSKDG